MKTIGIATIGLCLFFAGCASTNFDNPIPKHEGDAPCIHIVAQGSIPASSVYRSNFYVVGSNTNDTNAMARAFFTAEIVATMVTEALSAAGTITANTSEKYYETLKNNYRWRNDVFVYGYTNLNEKQIYDIIRYSTRPQVDAQRPPVIGKEE